MKTRICATVILILSIFSSGCAVHTLTSQGAKVVASSAPPEANCQMLGRVVGQSQGMFPGEDVVKYAHNDLRNKAAKLGANYVQIDDSEKPGFEDKQGDFGYSVRGNAYLCRSHSKSQ